MITNTDYASFCYDDILKDMNALEQNVQDYPASSLSHFLLLYYLKKNNDPRFNRQAKHTAIYLYNPYWMEFQLSKLQPDMEGTVPNQEDRTIQANAYQEESDTVSLGVKVSEQELPLPINDQITVNLPFETDSSESSNDEFLKGSEGGNSNQTENELIEEETNTEELPVAVNQQIMGNLPAESEVTDDFVEITNNDAILNNVEVEVPFVIEAKEDFKNDDNRRETRPERENEAYLSTKEEDGFNKEESVFNVKVPVDERNISIEATDNEEAANKEEEELAIPFEPLHTVDYFASQGIKLSEDALNNDQLGKQVKSFTAWLKSMKKLHPGQLPEQNEVIEKLIQTSSEASNQNANVLTEAMAEVLVKQGKREKAIEMYQKLSLINPSKSPYFAAKIESLKII